MKTAYIELNATNQISSLGKTRAANTFRYKGISFFPNASVTSLTEILRSDFEYFILDMGVLNLHMLQEFLRCDKSFLICSPGKWRLCETQEKIDLLLKNQSDQNQVTVIMNLCEKESKGQLAFPYLKNPFQLQPRYFHVFSQILERNYSYTRDKLG